MDRDKTHVTPPLNVDKQLKGKKSSNSCLIVIHGSNLGHKINLDKDEIIIGRGETADIRVDENNVSRKHSKIFMHEGNYIIEDQGSTNGTFINTKRKERTILQDQDLILIGNTILKFISSDNLENAYHEEIYRLATMDGMLQIYNKKFFVERLHNEFSRSKRYKRDLSLVMFDLDHFKLINDIHGHPAGDFVLKRISNLVMRNLRKEDIFGRYGGEEFAIILPETNSKQATIMAEKLRKLIENVEFKYQEKDIPVTVSLGVAYFSAETVEINTYNDLIERADQALYKAKNSGRNRVVCFEKTDT